MTTAVSRPARPGPSSTGLARQRGALSLRRVVVAACLLGAGVGAAVAIGAGLVDRPAGRAGTAGDRADVAQTAATLTADQRLELEAFRDQIKPLLATGAQVVGLGLRPGVGDISTGRYPPEVLAQMADGWVAELTGIRRDLAAVDAPPFLRTVHTGFLDAIDGYLAAAGALRSAATLDEGPERDALLARATTAGRAADRRYDAADAALTRLTAAPPRNEE